MRKPSVKPVTRALVRFLSYPCNNNVRHYASPVLVTHVSWLSMLAGSLYCWPLWKNHVAWGGGFVVSYVVSKLGFADQLAMTFLLAEGTSVCVVAIPLRTSTLVEVIAEARGVGTCAFCDEVTKGLGCH